MRRAMAWRQSSGMHSEYIEGFLLRPMMDAGYTAWLDGRRIGIVQFEDGEIVVEGETALVRGVLVRRLEADLRAAGVLGPTHSNAAAA
jgi:hypothetical protein